MIQVGEIVTLSDEKEYVVLNKIKLNKKNYLYLITTSEPLEIIIVNEQIENGSIILNEIKDNDELDNILQQFNFNQVEAV